LFSTLFLNAAFIHFLLPMSPVVYTGMMGGGLETGLSQSLLAGGVAAETGS